MFQMLFNIAVLGLLVLVNVNAQQRIDMLEYVQEMSIDALSELAARQDVQKKRADEIETAIGLKRHNGLVK